MAINQCILKAASDKTPSLSETASLKMSPDTATNNLASADTTAIDTTAFESSFASLHSESIGVAKTKAESVGEAAISAHFAPTKNL